MSEVEKIISSARDKYTVHNCGECAWRKCCSCGFGSADCMSRRESIFLKLGIEDGYFSKLLDDIEAAWKREKAELIYAYDPTKAGRGRLPDGSAYALEAMREPVTGCHAVGNAAALREAVIKALTLLNVCDWPSGVSLDGVGEVIREIDSVLDKPSRQCDFGTPDEQAQRFHDFCVGNSSGIDGMCKPTCPCIDCLDKCQCFAKWGQAPYTKEGGKQ